jgi:hypothetical protein
VVRFITNSASGCQQEKWARSNPDNLNKY